MYCFSYVAKLLGSLDSAVATTTEAIQWCRGVTLLYRYATWVANKASASKPDQSVGFQTGPESFVYLNFNKF